MRNESVIDLQNILQMWGEIRRKNPDSCQIGTVLLETSTEKPTESLLEAHRHERNCYLSITITEKVKKWS